MGTESKCGKLIQLVVIYVSRYYFELQADVFDPISLAPIFKGHDVVVSVLGFPKQLEETMTKFTESMSAILKAMKEAGVGRVVTISAWYTDRKTRVGQYMFDNMWTKVPGKHPSTRTTHTVSPYLPSKFKFFYTLPQNGSW